ncbi:protein translocase subunit SecD [Phycicoccus sp. BSK3Z-2]|uniref:Protein translocase subunit SecD n=1 Tax=Phycicoccus avicenniae TaxID=2828860 RepID=A0A941D680_9MICO|nr:protein translocase subunit SecD [Phycicoccus avicenniae]MBR7742381.1 protein translocase subunit SecD [Phycicoccus avicenniae]
MASATPKTLARRALIGITVLTVVLGGLLGGSIVWGSGEPTPKLGLDLEGGTQIILEPQTSEGQDVTTEQLNQARDIIVQRVDAGGVSGAEVTTQGDRNIVVSIPEIPTQEVRDAISRSSQMQFRPVLQVASGVPVPTPSPSEGGEPGASPSPSASSSASEGGDAESGDAEASLTPEPSATSNSALNEVLTAESPTPSGSDEATPSPSGSDEATPSPDATSGTGEPQDATSLEWVTPELQQQFDELDCTNPDAIPTEAADPTQPLVTCGDDLGKYILGPVVVSGADIDDATAGYRANQQGVLTSDVEIALSFSSEGSDRYADISRQMVSLPPPQNQLATVLDGRVIVAPQFNEAIPNGQASITGGFTLDGAQALADQLKFGALPLSFQEQSSVDISPTLGSEQLRYGFVAGLIGLALVVVYSLFQYRVLGFVTVASIVVAALLTYLAITILGWAENYRLDMAGITGLIIAIGFTADSFIVYFERIRDELRDGRSLAAAVETAWDRAKRTILIADAVNVLAALVLYVLASSSVRGFAFTLGLTTVIDIIVVFWFTHPLLTLLARRKFFREGHPWSGLDPNRLGASAARYVGRGRFVPRSQGVREPEGSHA